MFFDAEGVAAQRAEDEHLAVSRRGWALEWDNREAQRTLEQPGALEKPEALGTIQKH